MTTSDRGIALLKEFEGCVLKAYKDAAGVWTIGYGTTDADWTITGKTIRSGMRISQDQADEWLRESLKRKYEPLVAMYDNAYHFTQNEFDALVSFAYNIGSITKLTASGKRSREEIAEAWPTFNHITLDKGTALERKVENKGLTARRKKELALFLEPAGENDTSESEEACEITERTILLCGHGSGTPSTKNMEEYLSKRYRETASNGKRKGIVAARRLKAITDEGRQKFHDAYKIILGRNHYSQEKREYVFTKYTDGEYYSDCSSSGCAAMRKAGYDVPFLNTAGIYESPRFETVQVEIKEGHIINPEVLKVGDALLFVGNDPKRPLQIGHVEFVYEIDKDQIYPHWVQDGKNWYYRIEKGKNAHGWKLIQETGGTKKHWYYFDEKGKMLTGLQDIGGERFYLEEAGPLEGACCITDERGVLKIWDI